MVEYSHWRAELVPGLENEDVHIPDLLYALIVEKYQVPVVRAEETLTAGAADEHTAELLKIAPGIPVLVLNRTTYTKANRIIEVRTSKGRPRDSLGAGHVAAVLRLTGVVTVYNSRAFQAPPLTSHGFQTRGVNFARR